MSTQSTLAAKLIADHQPFGLSLPSRVASALGLQQAPLPFDEPVALQLAIYMESKYRFERSREQAMQRLLQALSQPQEPLAVARRA
ncbi:hypothetical protein D3C76_1315120 [compost metagenome]